MWLIWVRAPVVADVPRYLVCQVYREYPACLRNVLEVGVIAVSLRGRWFVKRHFFASLGPDCFRRNSDCHNSCWNVLNDDSPSANGSPFSHSNAFDQGGSGADVDPLF